MSVSRNVSTATSAAAKFNAVNVRGASISAPYTSMKVRPDPVSYYRGLETGKPHIYAEPDSDTKYDEVAVKK